MEMQLRLAILRSSDEQLVELERVLQNYLDHIVGPRLAARDRLMLLADAVRAEIAYREEIDDRDGE